LPCGPAKLAGHGPAELPGRRGIESVDSEEFGQFFTSFEHTAYRLETLQRYDVSYELEPFRAFLADEPRPHDPSKERRTAMIRNAAAEGKALQRVHVIAEPPTDYLRYELMWSYAPNVRAGEDIRILPIQPGQWPDLPHRDYWLFDTHDLWIMACTSLWRASSTPRPILASGVWTGSRHSYMNDAADPIFSRKAEAMAHRMDGAPPRPGQGEGVLRVICSGGLSPPC
jgi:hypothetical protein